jgi:hypothetical protein
MTSTVNPRKKVKTDTSPSPPKEDVDENLVVEEAAAAPAAAPAPATSTTLTLTRAERVAAAKAAFRDSYKVPTPITREIKSSGDMPTVTLRGVVLRTKTVQHTGRTAGQLVPKLEICIHVTSVLANSALDVISSGVAGFDWLLPTQKARVVEEPSDGVVDSTAAAEGMKRKKFGGAPRCVVLNEGHKTLNLNHVSRVSFYKTGNDGSDKDGMDFIVPGMPVEVSGVVANQQEGGAESLWLNASTVSPLSLPIPPSAIASQIIANLSSDAICETAALKLSATMRGFFGIEFDTAEKEAQAQWFRNKWLGVVSQTATACEDLSKSLVENLGTSGEALGEKMKAHAQRLRGMDAKDAASGKPLFPPATPVSQESPAMFAPLIVRGSTPAFPIHNWLALLMDGEIASRDLPETFVAPEVLEKPTTEGMLLKIKLRLTFVASKKSVVSTFLETQKLSFVTSNVAAVGLKLSLRTVAQATGLTAEDKAIDFSKDIFQFGDWLAVTGVIPRDPKQDNVFSWFPETFAIDVPLSLSRISVPVSEDWLRKNLAGGASQYVFEKDPSQTLLKQTDKITDLTTDISLAGAGYQEISGTSFKFSNARMPVGKTNKTYRVWFAGLVDSLVEDPEIASDEHKGEALLDNKGAADINNFLLTFCAVYVIAV